MKKLLIMAVLGLFLFGCGRAARESGFWSHPTMYRNWDHMKYSWSGYKNPTDQTGKLSDEEKWWGLATSEGKILWGHQEAKEEAR